MKWRRLFIIGIAFSAFLAASGGITPALANTVPHTPTQHFYGDADGDLVITGFDAIQHNNYVLSKPYTYDTLQPDTVDQRWNTCDMDSDRVCTGFDLIQIKNYILNKPVSIGARPWVLENVNLPLSGNPTGTWIPSN